MSKLNPGAYEFVPGKAFAIPQQPQRQDPPQPPAPPPTAPPVQPSLPPVSQSPAPKAKSSSVKPTTAGSSRTFTTDKSKSDTFAIAKEVKAVADDEILKDLYGDGSLISLCQ